MPQKSFFLNSEAFGNLCLPGPNRLPHLDAQPRYFLDQLPAFGRVLFFLSSEEGPTLL